MASNSSTSFPLPPGWQVPTICAATTNNALLPAAAPPPQAPRPGRLVLTVSGFLLADLNGGCGIAYNLSAGLLGRAVSLGALLYQDEADLESIYQALVLANTALLSRLRSYQETLVVRTTSQSALDLVRSGRAASGGANSPFVHRILEMMALLYGKGVSVRVGVADRRPGGPLSHAEALAMAGAERSAAGAAVGEHWDAAL